MENDLIIKCCHCQDYFPAKDTHTLKWEEITLHLCNDCFDNIPTTREEQALYIIAD